MNFAHITELSFHAQLLGIERITKNKSLIRVDKNLWTKNTAV